MLHVYVGLLMLCIMNVKGIVFQGCYIDSKYARVLQNMLPDSHSNTPDECARRCSDYRYAGVEFGEECHCGNTLEAIATSQSDCEFDCPGDPSKMCGGHWRISVYTNWVCGSPTDITNGNATLRRGNNITYGAIADVFCTPSIPVIPPKVPTTRTKITTRATSTITTPTSTVKPRTSTITMHSQMMSTSATNGQEGGTTYTSRDNASSVTKATSLDTATSQNNIQSTTALSAAEGSMTTVIAAGVSVAVTLAVAAVVIVLVLRKKLLPSSKITSTSNTDKHTSENGLEESYEDLVDRNESNTNYCVLGINIESADNNARYYNMERGQNNESETNCNGNSEYYNTKVTLENVEQDYMN